MVRESEGLRPFVLGELGGHPGGRQAGAGLGVDAQGFPAPPVAYHYS